MFIKMIDRLIGSVLGIVFGLVLAVGLMGLGVLNTLAAIVIAPKDILFKLYRNIVEAALKFFYYFKEFCQNIPNIFRALGSSLYKLGENIIAGIKKIGSGYPNPFKMLGSLLWLAIVKIPVAIAKLVFTVGTFVLTAVFDVAVFAAKSVFSLARHAVKFLGTVANSLMEIEGSMLIAPLVALTLPFAGFWLGLTSGIKNVFYGMFSNKEASVNRISQPVSLVSFNSNPIVNPANVQSTGPKFNILKSLQENFGPNLPVRRALSTHAANSQLVEVFETLAPKPPKVDTKNLKDKRRNELMENYHCPMTLNNVFDLTNPITIEYNIAGRFGVKVVDESAFIRAIKTTNTMDYAQLPGESIEITANDRNWITTDGGVSVTSSDEAFKIYRGIPSVVMNEITGNTGKTEAPAIPSLPSLPNSNLILLLNNSLVENKVLGKKKNLDEKNDLDEKKEVDEGIVYSHSLSLT